MSDASEWVPADQTVPRMIRAVQECRGCELWEDATQAVFSVGDQSASVVLVGEQPGDQEDRSGEPFVGPAGRLLDRALEAAELPRSEVYLTNAVKHFRHELRGRRRIHRKPDVRHLTACRPWLVAELEVVDPEVVVCLGASAGRSVLGRTVRVGAERGRVLDGDGHRVVLTAHPSSLLRLEDRGGYAEAFDALVADLRTAAAARG